MLVSVGLDFTPDGVSTSTALVTINMELLTEFRADNFECPNSRASEFLTGLETASFRRTPGQSTLQAQSGEFLLNLPSSSF